MCSQRSLWVCDLIFYLFVFCLWKTDYVEILEVLDTVRHSPYFFLSSEILKLSPVGHVSVCMCVWMMPVTIKATVSKYLTCPRHDEAIVGCGWMLWRVHGEMAATVLAQLLSQPVPLCLSGPQFFLLHPHFFFSFLLAQQIRSPGSCPPNAGLLLRVDYSELSASLKNSANYKAPCCCGCLKQGG